MDPDNAEALSEALCKPEQAAAKACPAASIVGHATAISPVLNQPLKGDVFFVEGTRQSKQGRTIKHSKVATLEPRLTATGKRLYKGRKAIRLRVSFNPTAKGQKTKHTRATVKRAKKASSSTRSHRSLQTR